MLHSIYASLAWNWNENEKWKWTAGRLDWPRDHATYRWCLAANWACVINCGTLGPHTHTDVDVQRDREGVGRRHAGWLTDRQTAEIAPFTTPGSRSSVMADYGNELIIWLTLTRYILCEPRLVFDISATSTRIKSESWRRIMGPVLCCSDVAMSQIILSNSSSLF